MNVSSSSLPPVCPRWVPLWMWRELGASVHSPAPELSTEQCAGLDVMPERCPSWMPQSLWNQLLQVQASGATTVRLEPATPPFDSRALT